MDLSTHLRPLTDLERAYLAVEAQTTVNHLRNVAFSGKSCGPKLAVLLERATGGAVRRWDLRPADWHLIWPELVGTEGAPAAPVCAREAARDASQAGGAHRVGDRQHGDEPVAGAA